MTTFVELPPIDLARTQADEDGCNIRFFGANGRKVARLRSHAVRWDGFRIFDTRTVATLFTNYGFVEILPDGKAVASAGYGRIVETGEDFSMLLDLAIAAGLVVEARA